MSIDEGDRQVLDAQAVEGEDLGDWRVLFASLHARFATGDFATGLALADRVGTAAEEMNHHPDLALSYPHLDVRLTSHDVGGVTRRDVRLAQRISGFAAELGATAAPADLAVLELALDTPDAAEIKPFWRAVLDLRDTPAHDELVDPAGRFPTVWFQESQPAPGAVPQRWHLDVRVPPEVVEDRLRAALDAGGVLDSDQHAPAFWVLADAQGNQACVTTWQGRG